MKVVLDFMGKKYKVKNIGDLNIDTYYLLTDLLDMDIPDYEKIKAILKLLTGIPDVDLIDDFSLNQIDYVDIIYEPILIKTDIIEFDKMSLNRFIDLEITQDIPTKYALCKLSSDWSNKELEYYQNEAKNIEIKYLLYPIQEYNLWYSKTIKAYDGLFESINVDIDDTEYVAPNKLDSWREIIYDLADGNILEQDRIKDMNVYEVFNWLVIKKNIYEKQKNKS